MSIQQTIETYKRFHRLTNYLSTAMLYLKDNAILQKELEQKNLKTRVLGHWGTVPGLNFVYAGANFIAKKYEKEILFIAGPGHGAPAILSNLYVEDSLNNFYPKYTNDLKGLTSLVKDFSWPSGFPSHTSPIVPGTILEGGELGYSLANAYGAMFDNPNKMAICMIGDGEAETATIATSWQSIKFHNPLKDGAVLPILHLNGYKISGPTLFSTMSDGEILCYFKGLGYDPIIVDQYTSEDVYIDFLEAMIQSYERIESVKRKWSSYQTTKPEWPVIILRTMKGWTGPESFEGKKVEDNHLSHGIPLKNPAKDEEEFKALKTWLESYNISELVNSKGEIAKDILDFLPNKKYRMGLNKLAFQTKHELKLPSKENHTVKVYEKGQKKESNMKELGEYLRELFRGNSDPVFRFFSPDETESNLLEEMFDATSRRMIWPVRKHDEHYSPDGMVMEVLSENLLFGWMTGYVITGRHGLLVSYEAFLNIISSQLDQYIKYLKQRKSVPFLKSIPSVNLVATSTLWRQEHNGYTHQNPSLINSLVTKHNDFTSVYFPFDANTLLVTIDETLNSTDKVNLIVACKRDIPQLTTLEEAEKALDKGIIEFDWMSNLNNSKEADVVLVATGDYQTVETNKAAKLLKELIPELSFKVFNINQMSPLGLGTIKNPIDTNEEFEKYFGKSHVVYNFHGYPEVIKQLTWNLDVTKKLKILGYIEEGTTTTALDMEVKNKASRFHVAIETIKSGAKVNPSVAEKSENIIKELEDRLRKHSEYIKETSEDLY